LRSDEGEMPLEEAIADHREEQLREGTVEAVLLDRHATSNTTYRPMKV